MRSEDIPQVTDIDREAFPMEYPPPSYKQRLESRLAHYIVAREEREQETQAAYTDAPNHNRALSGFRAWVEGLVHSEATPIEEQCTVGFSGFWLMLDEAHLVDIAVRKTHRGVGIGELLLASTIDLAARLNAHVVTLEVRTSNLVAQSLYQKYGFVEVGKRHRYYSDNGEDAILMTTEPIASASYQAFFQQLKQSYIGKWERTRSFLT
jgi:ribosomal-protein-alanine N-acetyltransferase